MRVIAEERLNWVGLSQGGAGQEARRAFRGHAQARAALARAVAMDPAFMLYDEPTTGLDPITADAINSNT